MNAEQAKALRAPFDPGVIGKLPKPTKKENPKGQCNVCGGWHGLPAVHLDYASHAAVTDRLLQVDPDWTWTPMAIGPHGGPLVVDGGLWIMLTVCGVTRPGFGDASGGKGPKEMIGDALRNAAMRFGVGLDLWAKEDLHAVQDSREAQEERARLERYLDSETERLVDLVHKPDAEAELRAKIATHRAKATPENHAAWLAKAITAALGRAVPGASREAAPGTPDAGAAPSSEEPKAGSTPVSAPVARERGTGEAPSSVPSAGTVAATAQEERGASPSQAAQDEVPASDVPADTSREGGGGSSSPSPFQPPPAVAEGPNAPCAGFAAGTTQAKTLKKLDVTVAKGRQAGWFTTADVYELARDIAPQIVQPDAYYLAEDGLHYSDLRTVVPLWAASQLIDALTAVGEMARARSAA